MIRPASEQRPRPRLVERDDTGPADAATTDSSAARLKSFVERIERLDEEIAGLNADKKEVYAEAKGTGFDVKIMRMLIAERRKEPQAVAEQNEMLDLYRAAMNGTDVATPAPARKSPPRPARAEPVTPHDPLTGEITEQNPEPGAGVESMGNGARAIPAETMLEPNLGNAAGRTAEDEPVSAAGGSPAQVDPTEDDLYQRAVTLVVDGQKASPAFVQRMLSLGYNKAVSLIERMQADGIVSRADVGGRRTVLITQQSCGSTDGSAVRTESTLAGKQEAYPAAGAAEQGTTVRAESNDERVVASQPVVEPGPQDKASTARIVGGPVPSTSTFHPAKWPDEAPTPEPAKRTVEMPDIPDFLKRATTNEVGRA